VDHGETRLWRTSWFPIFEMHPDEVVDRVVFGRRLLAVRGRAG
jgi:hypothetical protein